MTEGAAARAPAFGVYMHVPFCATLCPYCDFAVVVGRVELHERYCDALVAEASAARPQDHPPAETLFVGGGTPSAVAPALLARTITDVRAVFGIADDAEITIEANPESVDAVSLAMLADAGVNRVSIGVQSFDDDVLRALGRGHDAAEAARAVEAARAAGLANVSLDLIYGAPGETDESWRATVNAAIANGPDHVSCYGLTIEARTAFGAAVARGAMPTPDEDACADRYGVAADLLQEAGFGHYELSNWAKLGAESRHNLLYWTQGDYVGLGIGAHSHRAGERWWNTRAIARYVDAPASAREGAEHLSDLQRAQEWLTLRLRLVEGVDLDEVAARLGRSRPDDLDPLARDLESMGLVRLEGTRAVLTRRGMLLENEVALRLQA